MDKGQEFILDKRSLNYWSKIESKLKEVYVQVWQNTNTNTIFTSVSNTEQQAKDLLNMYSLSEEIELIECRRYTQRGLSE